MAVYCCGKNRKTTYCPQCGKKLADNPVQEVFGHLTQVVLERKKILDDAEKMLAGQPPGEKNTEWTKSLERAVARRRKELEQATARLQALSDLMDKANVVHHVRFVYQKDGTATMDVDGKPASVYIREPASKAGLVRLLCKRLGVEVEIVAADDGCC